MQALAKRFNLSQQFGTAPQDYFLSRAPIESNQSLPGFFIRDVSKSLRINTKLFILCTGRPLLHLR